MSFSRNVILYTAVHTADTVGNLTGYIPHYFMGAGSQVFSYLFKALMLQTSAIRVLKGKLELYNQHFSSCIILL